MPYMFAKCSNPGLQRIVAEVHQIMDELKEKAKPGEYRDKATVNVWWIVYRLEDVLDLLMLEDEKITEHELEETKARLHEIKSKLEIKDLKEVHKPDLSPLEKIGEKPLKRLDDLPEPKDIELPFPMDELPEGADTFWEEVKEQSEKLIEQQKENE